MADHSRAISVTVNLAAAPVAQQGFGVVLYLVDEAAGNTLDGDRVRSYSEPSDADDDETAGFITAAVAGDIKVALAQRPRPDEVLVGRVDTGAGTPETYSAALAACRLVRDDFYAVCMDSRTAATQVALAATIEASENILVLQSSDSDWLTASVPGGYSAIDGYERTAVIYHDTDTESADLAHAVKFTVQDPDIRCSPGTVPLKSVAALATTITAAERTLLLGNDANVALPLGGETAFVLNGTMMSGRPMHEILTADWLTARYREAVARLLTGLGARNEKLPVTRTGQSLLIARLDEVNTLGIQAGHFEPGQVEVTAPTITSADADTGTLRATVRAQVANTAILFSITVDASRTALASA